MEQFHIPCPRRVPWGGGSCGRRNRSSTGRSRTSAKTSS
jgi:hypothetical protein